MQWLMPKTTPAHVWMYRRLRGRIVNKATGGAPVLLLTTAGRRSGKPRTVALGHLRDGDDVIVAGTNGGLPELPAWLLNLRANPSAHLQVGGACYPARGEFLDGEESDECWRQFVDAYPAYEQARRWAGRPVPLIRLHRIEGIETPTRRRIGMTAEADTKAVQKAEIRIAAPPEQVYELVSDVTRTGEWSPECRRCRWVNGAERPVPGARFRGYNQYRWLKWSRLNEVLVAEPGREFAFKVLPDWFNKDSSIWRYRLEAVNGGTRVSESQEVLAWPAFPVRFMTLLVRREDDMTENIQQSLQRIKEIVEGGGYAS